MVLRQLQTQIMRTLASNRSETSYFAGCVVLKRDWPRRPDDIDVFQDADEAVVDTADHLRHTRGPGAVAIHGPALAQLLARRTARDATMRCRQILRRFDLQERLVGGCTAFKTEYKFAVQLRPPGP